MKIGVVTGIFHPEAGGPATYLYYLLPLIQARGHEVRVLTFGEPDPHDYGYPVTRISRMQSFPRRLWAYWRELVRLARWSDTLFVMGYVVHLPALRPLYRKRIVTKIVGDYVWEYASRHGYTSVDPVQFQSAKLSPKLSLIRRVYHYAVNRSDAVIVPSDFLGGLVRGWNLPASRLHVVYNAIPDTDLHTADRAALRRQLNLPPDVRILVTVARLTLYKDIDVTIKALENLPDCHLVLVGDGPMLEALQAMAPAGRVHFVGRQPHDVTMQYLRAADIFVLNSRVEGLSHVLLEALAVATPAIATNVGGNPEVITDGVNGLLVPTGDPAVLADALVKAVRRLLDDPILYARLEQAGRARSQDFNWDAAVNKTLSVLLP